MTWMIAHTESLLQAALWVVVAVVIGAFGRPARAGEYGGHHRG